MFSKEQRHDIYLKLLEEYQSAINTESLSFLGLCICLESVLYKHFRLSVDTCINQMQHLPELLEQRPSVLYWDDKIVTNPINDSDNYFWWSTKDTESRINAINIAIVKTT